MLKINWKEKLSNYGCVVSLSIVIGQFLSLMCDVDIDAYTKVANSIITALLALGILNDNSGKWYSDSKEDK